VGHGGPTAGVILDLGVTSASPFPERLSKARDGATMLHQLRFEYEDGQWRIYLLGRDKPIGDIRPALGRSWFGQMSLDGRTATFVGADPQDIVDRFDSWVAAGMPPDPELLNRTPAKHGASLSADVAGKLRPKK
jgi:hypothetical protein